ncbi:dTDP-4-dehydrorhamnose reductase family protein [Sphingobium baderi]|uniref:dTDP-4-dehydrorhamnose reductase n=1 Tax=Sphingobium baderi LL03 TaxID=1114964 RepID=T0GVP9_9SPHN|nr:sugar nucleotide-binding protein [Sphingobium baderi]EQB04742.1 hypothetical protein L485_03855 [Sphingobium baderi LL03]KMS51796.1 dTDP-4-dehydrorhamnose reductase [Sphingobium baderi LL03]
MHDGDKNKVLVLGAGGMLGNAIFRLFVDGGRDCVTGTLRSASKSRYFTREQRDRLIYDIDVTDDDALAVVFDDVQPTVVINCIGIIKQHSAAKDPLTALTINAVLPHRLAQLCKARGARLVHMSTDCVFSGKRGGYREGDFPDADDLYGRTKYLGETHYPHTVTLRTSIVGHELGSAYSLIDWFLSQQGSVKGYGKAIFSGLPTIEVARVIRDLVYNNPTLTGVYHLSADPISKQDLLCLVAQAYDKDIEIVPDMTVNIDRSLDSERFRQETGYVPVNWPDLVQMMYQDHLDHVRSVESMP